MPRITSYTPGWLSTPSPGYHIFSDDPTKTQPTDISHSISSSSNCKRTAKPGPRRCLARRGKEVFVAVGKEIRWADLIHVKEVWEDRFDKNDSSRSTNESFIKNQHSCNRDHLHRTIKTPVAEKIRQLIICPFGNHMAILTTHTIHISILPEPSQLNSPDQAPIKLKFYTLGPTTHVTSQAGIVTALWHPLGVNGTCIVTITEDAVVRLWELSIGNHASFDQPTLEIDLKKLVDATSEDQDFKASSSGVISKTFSPDSFEMQVASACFAGKDSKGWSPMTLWIAMRNGDIYALCPLLPEKWSATPDLISSLSVSIVTKAAALNDDFTISHSEENLAQQQLAWMSDIDNQEPQFFGAPGDTSIEVFRRPSRLGSIPKLQGPLDLELVPEDSINKPDDVLSDIYVIGASSLSQDSGQEVGADDDLDNADQEGLSVDIICLLTSGGRLSVCLSLDEIEAQWLPKSKPQEWKLLEEEEFPSLITFEVIDILRDIEICEKSWPLFSNDASSPYSFFITTNSSIDFIDFTPWIFRLGAELDNTSAGSEFRIDLLAKGSALSTHQRIITSEFASRNPPFSASVSTLDSDLGYFILTANSRGPVAIVFEWPGSTPDFHRSVSQLPDFEVEKREIIPVIFEPRPIYDSTLFMSEDSKLPSFIDKIKYGPFKRLLKEEVRLSPAILSTMTEAHKVISEETSRIGAGAAELFRRFERLQINLIGHIKMANEVATRVKAVTGSDNRDKTRMSRQLTLEERLETAQQRQKNLSYRIERLRKKAVKSMCLPISDREKLLIEEVQTLESKILAPERNSELIISKEPWARYAELSTLSEILVEQVTHLTDIEKCESPQLKVPEDIKRQKFEMVQAALDRETALVEAAKKRMDSLAMAF